MNEEQDRATASTYEDEITSQRTVTIPLREYDELKADQRFIKDKSLIAIIDKVEELIRALRKEYHKREIIWMKKVKSFP